MNEELKKRRILGLVPPQDPKDGVKSAMVFAVVIIAALLTAGFFILSAR